MVLTHFNNWSFLILKVLFIFMDRKCFYKKQFILNYFFNIFNILILNINLKQLKNYYFNNF